MERHNQQALYTQNRFSFSGQQAKPQSVHSNLHKEYVQQYQKYSAATHDPMDETTHCQTLRQQSWKRISHQKLSRQQLTVQQLQKQNSELTHQLSQSQKYLEQLQERLLCYELTIQKIQAVCQYQEEVIVQMRQEITLVLEKNSVLQLETEQLRKQYLSQQQMRGFGEMSLQEIEQNINRRSQNELYNKKSARVRHEDGRSRLTNLSIRNIEREVYPTLLEKQNSLDKQYPLSQEKRQGQLVGRIKEMYAKIMETQISSLNQLWKWLKDMGQSYSSLRKWKKRAKDSVISALTSKNQTLAELLLEACGYLVDS